MTDPMKLAIGRILKERVDERRRRGPRQKDERADKQHDDDDRRQPPLLVVLEKIGQLREEAWALLPRFLDECRAFVAECLSLWIHRNLLQQSVRLVLPEIAADLTGRRMTAPICPGAPIEPPKERVPSCGAHNQTDRRDHHIVD